MWTVAHFREEAVQKYMPVKLTASPRPSRYTYIRASFAAILYCNSDLQADRAVSPSKSDRCAKANTRPHWVSLGLFAGRSSLTTTRPDHGGNSPM